MDDDVARPERSPQQHRDDHQPDQHGNRQIDLGDLHMSSADRLAAADAVFTADGGTPTVCLLRHVRANGARRFLISLLHGTVADAYPQALGIANAYPQRQVIALCADSPAALPQSSPASHRGGSVSGIIRVWMTPF